jgi:transcriptional regulator with XRE-family HTH domain
MALWESPILTPMPPTVDQVVRDRIRTWITSTGVTQTELAERIGRTQAWMSRYLHGEFDADLETLQKMAHAFGQGLGALLDAPTDPMEARVVEGLRALPANLRTMFINLLEEIIQTRGRSPGGRSRR